MPIRDCAAHNPWEEDHVPGISHQGASDMTALVLAAIVFMALAVLGDLRTRHRLRRALSEAAPAAATPKRRRRRRRGSPAPSPIPSPLLLELLAALLESGAPPPTALRHLAAALAKTGDSRAEPLEALALDLEQGITTDALDLETAAPPAPAPIDAALSSIRRLLGRASPPSAGDAADPALSVLREAVRMAALAGLPPAALTRRAASEERRRLGAARRRAIRRLEVILVLPVGLCLLPAFVLLGVIPVVIDLFTG
jgi:hypothetical protein